MSASAARAGAAPKAAAPRPPAKGKPRGKGPAKGGAAPSRLGRLGRWGWAVLLGTGVILLSPVVHAFWGDLGVIVLGIFVLGFLLGRWTAA